MRQYPYPYKRPNFFQRHFSFSGKIEPGLFWSDVGMSVIEYFCVVILACIGVCVLVPGSVEKLNTIMVWITLVAGMIWLLSLTAMTRRRLRDAGLSAKTYLWLLLPFIGWIVFVVLLCRHSA